MMVCRQDRGAYLNRSMEFRKKNRPASIGDFLALLEKGSGSIEDATTLLSDASVLLEESTVLCDFENSSTVIQPEGQTTVYVNQKQDFTKDLINRYMVKIPGGEFSMGHDSVGWLVNSNASPNESPKHKVKLSDFYICKFTVTRGIWNYVMKDKQLDEGGDDIPVDNISWNEIQVFLKKLNGLTGENYRLPTEAEWEYAARGGRAERAIYAGDDSIDMVGWYKDNSEMKIHPVGQKFSNGYGLYDMSGNVWEWCADGFQKYVKKMEINPLHDNSNLKVLRGGSCASEKWKCRVTCRASAPPDTKKSCYGFRLAK